MICLLCTSILRRVVQTPSPLPNTTMISFSFFLRYTLPIPKLITLHSPLRRKKLLAGIFSHPLMNLTSSSMIKSKWDNLFSFSTQLSTIIYAFQWVKVAKNNKTNMICFLCTNVLLISDGFILLMKNLSCSFESLDILAKVVQFFRYYEQKILLEALGCLKTMIQKLRNFERLGAKLNALRF